MTRPLADSMPETKRERELAEEVRRLQEVVDALVDRVEREQASMDETQYGYFQTAMALEERVQQRTQALASALERLEASNQQFREAKEEADRANKAKSEFLATMSHEIRTPMHGVVGAIELLDRTRLDVEQKSLLNTLRGACDSMLRLIDDILDIARLERQNIELELEPVDLRSFLGSLTSLFAPRATAKGLSFRCDVPEDLPVRVSADAHRLRQILSNLLSNAVKFTHTGSVSVEAAVERPGNRTAMLHFTVRDTGIGIDDALHAKVFEAFQQGDSSTTRLYGGTGLGLAIASRLAEAMNGQIVVAHNKPQGTMFTLSVPVPILEDGSATAPEADVALLHARANTHAQTPSRRFLVVDDSDLNRNVLTRMLKGLADHVDETTNGEEAVAACRRQAYDLVFMDWRMPKMDGLQATSIIRQLPDEAPTSRDVPVVGLTANVQPAEQEACRQAGMTRVLAKPFFLDDLLRCVNDVLKVVVETER